MIGCGSVRCSLGKNSAVPQPQSNVITASGTFRLAKNRKIRKFPEFGKVSVSREADSLTADCLNDLGSSTSHGPDDFEHCARHACVRQEGP
jgi:hypothetical protein